MNQDQVSKVAWYSVALMSITSIHHAYGAVIYNTPWRMHILMISMPVIVLTLVLSQVLKKKEPFGRSFLFWTFWVITLVPSLGMIGLFEGIYNHVLKNILYFGGLNGSMLRTLFPAPKYELPNDLLFEVTGVLQGIVVIPLIVQMVGLTSSRLRPRKAV